MEWYAASRLSAAGSTGAMYIGIGTIVVIIILILLLT